MEAIIGFLGIVLFIFTSATLIGLIRPSLIKQKTRPKAMAATLLPALAISVAINVLSPPEDSSTGKSKQSTKASSKSSKEIQYKITKDTQKRHVKRSVEVRLPRRVDKNMLRSLAHEIHKDGFDRTFIGYRIKGNEEGLYWATTHFNPDLKIKISGSEKEEHEKLVSSKHKVDGKVIGKWLVNYGFNYKSIMYKEGDKKVIKNFFSGGGSNKNKLTTEKKNGETRYYEDSGKQRYEYYTIGSNGRLKFWSENGNYYTAPKAQ